MTLKFSLFSSPKSFSTSFESGVDGSFETKQQGGVMQLACVQRRLSSGFHPRRQTQPTVNIHTNHKLANSTGYCKIRMCRKIVNNWIAYSGFSCIRYKLLRHNGYGDVVLIILQRKKHNLMIFVIFGKIFFKNHCFHHRLIVCCTIVVPSLFNSVFHG